MTYCNTTITADHVTRAFEMRRNNGTHRWQFTLSLIEQIAYQLAVAGF